MTPVGDFPQPCFCGWGGPGPCPCPNNKTIYSPPVQPQIAPDLAAALARELAAALVREHELREALANAAGALDSAGEELSEFANILSRDPWQANHAYESAVQARAALGDRA